MDFTQKRADYEVFWTFYLLVPYVHFCVVNVPHVLGIDFRGFFTCARRKNYFAPLRVVTRVHEIPKIRKDAKTPKTSDLVTLNINNSLNIQYFLLNFFAFY